GVDLTGIDALGTNRLNRLIALRKIFLDRAAILGNIANATEANVNTVYGELNAFQQHAANSANATAEGHSVDADEAARKAREAAELATAKTDAKTAIENSQKETGKPKITDPELNKHLKEIDKAYIEAAGNKNELNNRQKTIADAIATLRKAKEPTPFEAAKAQNEFDDKNTQTEIDSKKTELITKIDAAKAQEKPTPEQKAEEVKKLKTPEQIKEFITESVPEQEKEEFVKHLSELTEVEKPTGSGKEEQFKNFMAQQKAEVVVKAVCSYKLKKDDNLRNEIATEMETKKDAEGQLLDEKVYPKKDGKYTPEAMVKYLFEKKTGQAHAFSAKSSGNQNSPTSPKSH
ncbi:11618_t:CDS:2, partial [Ambispora leptoticha]